MTGGLSVSSAPLDAELTDVPPHRSKQETAFSIKQPRRHSGTALSRDLNRVGGHITEHDALHFIVIGRLAKSRRATPDRKLQPETIRRVADDRVAPV